MVVSYYSRRLALPSGLAEVVLAFNLNALLRHESPCGIRNAVEQNFLQLLAIRQSRWNGRTRSNNYNNPILPGGNIV
ncbi:MAG: hypothetical protein ACRD2O_03505 [Terriglobia bacterium]